MVDGALERAADAVGVVEGGDREGHRFESFAEVVVIRCDHDRRAGGTGRDRELAVQRRVVGAVESAARQAVVDFQRRGGAAGAVEEEDPGVGAGFGRARIGNADGDHRRVVIAQGDGRGGRRAVADVGGVAC